MPCTQFSSQMPGERRIQHEKRKRRNQKALEGKTPHTNEWNVINQLLDLVEADREAKRIVSGDLENENLSIDNLVRTVLRGRPGPIEVMKKICEFYGLPCPDELPPEVWRGTATNAPKQQDDMNLFDLL